MAGTITVRLSRPDNSPWGFRLQGGKDFGQPLLIQKVNGGSPAERAGLQVGDALLRVNNADVSDLRHKEAQDTIVRAGNSFELTLQRGGTTSTWRPEVSPVGSVPHPGKASPATTVTKTSLAASGKSPLPHIGAGHNLTPKPFGSPQVNGGDPSVKAIVNKQYNTPVQMYSEENIAETLSAQAEVLAGGAIGVNFMKNEKSYDSQKSEVFKMVQEVDKEPREPDTPGGGIPGGLRHVEPPKPVVPAPGSPQQLPPGQNICADCERLIVGVFVRIKDKNLHVECFKCATCGTSLKNVGYYNINNKLYCDIHAKMVARQNPPAPNLEPVTVPPGGRTPSGAFTVAKPAAPLSPQPGTLAPLPFHAPRTTTSHVVAPWYGRQTSAPSKPFSSVSAPSTAPFSPSSVAPAPFSNAPAPFSSVPPPPAAPSSFSKPTSDSTVPVVWPPTKQQQTHLQKAELTSSSFSSTLEEKRLSICSEEVSKIESHKRLDVVPSILEEERPASPVPAVSVRLDEVEQSLIRAGERVKARTPSPLPPRSPRSRSPRPITPRHFKPEEESKILDVSSRPHGLYSLLPSACTVRPLSPKQVVVFPPEVPAVIYSRSPTPHRKEIRSPDRWTTCPSPMNALVPYTDHSSHSIDQKERKITKDESHHHVETSSKIAKVQSQQKIEQKTLKSTEKIQSGVEKKFLEENKEETSRRDERKSPNVKMDKLFYSKSEVEKIIHEEVLRALTTKEEKKEALDENVEVSVHDLPKPIAPGGWMTSALTTASERPFTPVPFPKPMELPSVADRIIPMTPVQVKKDEKAVPLPVETQPYFPPAPPPPDKEGLDDRAARALREVGCCSPMTHALTVASDCPYSPLPSQSQAKTCNSAFKPVQPTKKDMSLTSALTVAPTVPFTVPGRTPIPFGTKDEAKPSAFKPFNSQEKRKMGVDMISIAGGGHTKQTIKEIESGKMMTHFEKTNETLPSPVPHSIVSPSVKPTDPYIPQPSGVRQETRLSRKEMHERSKTEENTRVEYLQISGRPARPVTPSGLHPPGELPYYQQNIGVIPVRNKSVSPQPHLIKAPQLHPDPPGMTRGYKSTTYSETKTCSAQKTNLQTLTSNITNIATKKEVKPAPVNPTPHWKMETKRTVQNLSPITVRLASPRPVTPVQGETQQAANAKVQIFKPRPTSPLPPKIKVQVEYPNVPSSSGPSIGSEKSAFAPVKNGSSNQIKKAVESSSKQLESSKKKENFSLKCGEICQKQQCEDVCQKKCEEVCFKKAESQSQRSIQSSRHADTVVCQKSSVAPCSSKDSTVCERKSQIPVVQNQNQDKATSCQRMSNAEVFQNQQVASQKMTHAEVSQSQHAATQKMINAEVFQSQHALSQKMTNAEVFQSQQVASQKMSNAEVSQSQQVASQKMSNAEVFQSQHSASQKMSSTSKSQLMEQKSIIQQKAAHSGVTSFRVYGETSNKTINSDESLKALKMEHAVRGRTFEESTNGSKKKPEVKSSGNVSSSAKDTRATTSNLGATNVRAGCPLPTLPSLPPVTCDPSPRPTGPGVGSRVGTLAGSSAPRRGRGLLNAAVGPGARIPLCGHCNLQIRGPFITALGKIWCPEHFVCVNSKCRRPLQDIGFVEEQEGLYCEFCFEQYLAPTCDKCHGKIKGDCLNAIGKHFHPECFACAYCGKLFGNNPFFLEDALPYCENDWNELFTTKCFSCGFPIEAGDRWVEALNNNYHSQCFNCTMCKKNLEGQSFFAKAGRPFCKNHAR